MEKLLYTPKLPKERQWSETATVPMQYVLNAIGGRTL